MTSEHMKVVWLTPVLLPEMLHHLGQQPSVRAGWISSLLTAMRMFVPEVGFTVVALAPVKEEIRFEVNAVTYFLLPGKYLSAAAKSRVLARAAGIVREAQADIVHVHGTESFFSLMACEKDAKVPVVVSIQGLLSKCLPYQCAGLSLREKLTWQCSLRDILARQGPLCVWWSWRKKVPDELRVLREGRYFIGRTRWDRANVLALNPNASYFHGDEVLRPVFYMEHARPATISPSILLVGRAAPIKGITVFLDALAILRRRGVCCKARVFGRFNPKDGLGAVLLRRVRALRLEGCIELIGNQTDENVAKELAAATVFVHPSFVDNSPNSICEAMLVGTPVVANSCGGMPSLIRHDETGILVSSGDPEVLAEEIVRLLENPVKARELAERGRQEALIRHDPGRVALRQANIYSEILQNFQNKGTEG